MGNNVQAGQLVTWQNTDYLIRSIKPELGDIVLEAKGGLERTVDLHDFYNLIAAGELGLPSQKIEASIRVTSVTEQAEADFRQALALLMNQLAKQEVDGPTRKQKVDAFCLLKEHKRPSDKTIQSYQRAYKAFGYSGLIPSFSHRGGSGWSKKKTAKDVAERVVIETFIKDDKVNLTTVSAMVSEELKRLNFDGGIDRKTVGRVLLNLPKALVKGGRLDPRTFSLYNRQAVKCYDVTLPLERIEIDAKTIDVYCCDELGNRYTELTLYAMVCSCTSYPVGIYVSAGKPSEYTLLKVFEFFFTPKDQAFKEYWGIQTDWVAPCSLKTVVLDNASENASKLVLQIVRRLGIEVVYARIARGDDKPHVESFFKSVDDALFNLIPGAKNSQDKRVKNRHARAEAESCYSVEEIYRNVIKYVADVYIHKPKVRLGFKFGTPMSIKSAMDEALKRFMPLPPPSLDKIKCLILETHRTDREVQHYGVDYEGFQFHSHEFGRLAKERVLKRVDILFNPEDCTAIYAVHPDDDSLVKLDNKMVGIPAVSFKVAKALHKAYASPAGVMTGHDYQKAYAKMRAQFLADSRRRPKIKANNQALREHDKLNQKADIAEQIGKRTPVEATQVWSATEPDDDITPAPRKGLSDE